MPGPETLFHIPETTVTEFVLSSFPDTFTTITYFFQLVVIPVTDKYEDTENYTDIANYF